MSDPLHGLSDRIQSEITEIEGILARIEEGWRRASSSGDDYYLDGVALNLHGYYSGIERIFERVAETLDGTLPKGENWHQALLVQMTKEIPGIRPALISENTYQRLNEYRGFRHIVRNVYTTQFDPAKIEKLVADAGKVFVQVRNELLAFTRFLNHHRNI